MQASIHSNHICLDHLLRQHVVAYLSVRAGVAGVEGLEGGADGEERLERPHRHHDDHHDGEDGDGVAGHVHDEEVHGDLLDGPQRDVPRPLGPQRVLRLPAGGVRVYRRRGEPHGGGEVRAPGGGRPGGEVQRPAEAVARRLEGGRGAHRGWENVNEGQVTSDNRRLLSQRGQHSQRKRGARRQGCQVVGA